MPVDSPANPGEPPRAALGLAYRGLRIGVEAPERALLDWLAEFLAPAFAPRELEPADCRVAVVVDAERLAAARARAADDAAPITCLVQDRELITLPARRDAGGLTILHDEARVAYQVSPDRRHITVLTGPGNRDVRGALMKVVREVAMSAAWTPDGLVLHAAACAVGECATLIAGPKRAGKTSLLLHALGIPGARLLANDRTVLAAEDGRLVAHGLPTIVTLRPDTVARRFADETARRSALRYGFGLTVAEAEARPPVGDPSPRQLGCSPAQLARLLGVELVGPRAAAALLLPRVDPAARGIALRRLDDDEAARRLPDVLFAAHSAPQVSEAFALPARSAVPGERELPTRWRNAVERLRVFDCRLGPDAYAGDPAVQLAAALTA